jgi:hypothetical protein
VHASAYIITYADNHIPNVIGDPDSEETLHSKYSPRQFKEIVNITHVGITKPLAPGLEAIRKWIIEQGLDELAWVWMNGVDHFHSYVHYGKRNQIPVSYSYLSVTKLPRSDESLASVPLPPLFSGRNSFARAAAGRGLSGQFLNFGLCANWPLCQCHPASVPLSPGLCADVTRPLCQCHQGSVPKSPGLCANVTRALCQCHLAFVPMSLFPTLRCASGRSVRLPESAANFGTSDESLSG